MEKINPKLSYGLAKEALWHFYHNQYWTEEELFVWKKFCDKNPEKLWKLKMRLLCEENNDMIVAAVVADATEEEKIFLSEKYQNNESYGMIAKKLNIHPNGLQRWRDKFLSNIKSLMEYKLPLSDIFSRNKVEALIYVLERVINFYEEYNQPDEKIFEILKYKLDKYHNLLFVIKYYLYSESSKKDYEIIRTKIQNPNLTIKEIANETGRSRNSVSQYISCFQEQFK